MRIRGLALPAAALLAWGTGVFAARSAYRSPFPPPGDIRVPAEGAAGDMFSLAFGMRRLFADLWFVRLMQYYGTPELQSEEEEEAHAGHTGPHPDPGFGSGLYPEFQARARHVLEIDPGFTAAALYGAGSLAFNLNRPGEAEELLSYALKYSPKEWKYLNVLAAIGYSKAKDPAAVAASIAPLLKEPDCPVMLKQLSAFLNKKNGNLAAAAAIYADIAATSHDAFYVNNARRELEKFSRGIKQR